MPHACLRANILSDGSRTFDVLIFKGEPVDEPVEVNAPDSQTAHKLVAALYDCGVEILGSFVVPHA